MPVVLIGIGSVLHRHHDLMQFLTHTDPHLRHLAAGKHCLSQIRDLKGGYFGDKGLSAPGFLQRLDHKLHTLLYADPESGHPIVRNGQLRSSVFHNIVKERNHGASAARHITIPDDGKTDILFACVGVGSDKELVRDKLCAPV